MITVIPGNLPPPQFPMIPRDLSTITDLVIHHTDGPPNQSIQSIDGEHRNLKPPDAMIAYNWVISNDGKVYSGRPTGFISAASHGRNPQSVAICLTGDFQEKTPNFAPPTDAQIEALKELAFAVHISIPSIVRTYGHGEIAQMFYKDNNPGDYSTACPGNVLLAKLSDVRKYIHDNLVRH